MVLPVTDHVATLARLTPGDAIPPAAAAWLIESFQRYVTSEGTLPLDICLGIRRTDSDRSARQRRGHHLIEAYRLFQPTRSRLNASKLKQFAALVKSFTSLYQQFKRTGRIPRAPIDLHLYLAFEAGRVPKSETQLRRIIQPY